MKASWCSLTGSKTWLISLREAANRLPGQPHVSTVWRWATFGIGPDRIKLETVAVGGRKFATQRALLDFIASLNSVASREAIDVTHAAVKQPPHGEMRWLADRCSRQKMKVDDMGWVQEGNGLKYYRSVRVGNRVERHYIGSGPIAETAAAADAARREERKQIAQELADMKAQMRSLNALMTTLHDSCKQLLNATMLAAGYHRPNGNPWRKRHVRG